ncbi:hypothetical protein FKP32DRAFT_404744 [Trametes sanguinea]|nr:hypothetical protein FKP32DRAFT_404744 [Trametes sanguinea]
MPIPSARRCWRGWRTSSRGPSRTCSLERRRAQEEAMGRRKGRRRGGRLDCRRKRRERARARVKGKSLLPFVSQLREHASWSSIVQQDPRETYPAFRLLSGVTQPKPIVLAPKPPPVYKCVRRSVKPLREDTEAEAARRAARAREVAVDFAWVMKESSKPYIPLPNAAKKERTVTARLPSPSPPLLLLEVSKPAPKPPHPAHLDPTLPIEPSPHAHETSPSCCPIVPASPNPSLAAPSSSSTAATAADSEKERKRKRRRGKGKGGKPAVQPAFWRPREGMGGKSAGYGLGYPGWPLREGDVPRYHRDTMRKAVFVLDT